MAHQRSRPNVWYCPSRWLMAHHDSQADIYTQSSHMCLADLNNEGENLLALIDFKKRPIVGRLQQQSIGGQTPPGTMQPPYDCRLRIYRGQQLIYNHFLDDMPSCLVTASIRGPVPLPASSLGARAIGSGGGKHEESSQERALLAVTINDDIYFYHKLKPSHRVSLEDDDCIMDLVNKSEYDIWQMVRQNKVDVETMRELLVSLSNELGSCESLTSHSSNFLALQTNEERKNYLLLWKFKRMSNGMGEHIMSMDTICCAAARLKYSSNITRSGDYGQTREPTGGALLLSGGSNIKYNRIIDLLKDGLVVGTEDKHLLIYELRLTRAILETNYRLPSTADHILVERRSPASFDYNDDPKTFTYKILVSCRNCRVYSIDQPYIVPADKKTAGGTQVKELLALKCNALDMCWTTDEQVIQTGDRGISQPNFIVACLDRRVYCFSSRNGQCKWSVETELPITCVVSLPAIQTSSSAAGSPNESRLIGVASQANRIDFHVSQTGRIVDSIYLGDDDHCQAMTFGRFGREDNCLCLTTKLGHLLIFILKRTAKFAHGQCLSSAAAHAAAILSNCSHLFQRQQQQSNCRETGSSSDHAQPGAASSQHRLRLNAPPSLPSAFALANSWNVNPADQAIELLQVEHSCDQVLAKSTLDAHLVAPQLQVPAKSRDFVDQIVDQSRHSTAVSRVFARHMVKLRDKIRSTIEQQSELGSDAEQDTGGNRITLSKITGLGNTYRVSLSLRVNLKRYAEDHHLLSATDDGLALSSASDRTADSVSQTQQLEQQPDSSANQSYSQVVVLLFVAEQQQQQQFQCQVKPFRFELGLVTGRSSKAASKGGCQWIFEKTIEFKLLTGPINVATNTDSAAAPATHQSESVSLDVYIMFRRSDFGQQGKTLNEPQRPVFISSVNIPTC